MGREIDRRLWHQVASNAETFKKRILELLREGRVNVEGVCKVYPQFEHYIRYYAFKVAELEYQANVFADLSRRVFKESGGSRKEVALRIGKHRLRSIGFCAISSEKSGSEILAEMRITQYCKYVPTYCPERLSKVFYGDGSSVGGVSG